MITFCGYAVMKDGKYLGYNPRCDKFNKLPKKQFYKQPVFPVVSGKRFIQKKRMAVSAKVVKVKLTMEEMAE